MGPVCCIAPDSQILHPALRGMALEGSAPSHARAADVYSLREERDQAVHGGAGSHCGTRLSRGQGGASLLYRTKRGDGALGGAGGLAIVHADYVHLQQEP